MSTFASKARAIASYFASRRQRGHSTVQREGYARHPKTTLVVADWGQAGEPALPRGAISLGSTHFEGLLGGFNTPLVIEHEALRLLLEGLLREMDGLQMEREVWAETARQSERNADYYRGLIDKTLAVEPAAYEGDDGSKHPAPLRAKLPEIVGKYRADIAHRDRALRRLAEVLTLCGGTAPAETVEDVMRATACDLTNPAKPEKPIRITVSADVDPFLKALDELSCALRGLRRDEPKAGVSA